MSDATINTPAPREPLELDDLKAILKANWADAKRYCDDELAPSRDTATRYYNGEPFGNEDAGRSQVVMTEVRDTVHAIMPSLMRIFTGTEQAMEFAAQAQGDEQQAQQATDYVRFVTFDLCEGFMALHAAFKDALIRKTGILKWWCDTEIHQRGEEYTGLTHDQVMQIANSDGANIVSAISRPASPQELAALGINPQPAPMPMPQPPPGAPPGAPMAPPLAPPPPP